MTLQEQIEETKAKLAELEAQAKLAELEAQQLSEIKPGMIVWAWDDDLNDEHDARLTILKTVHGPKRYTCQHNEYGDTMCYDNIKVHSMPPSKDVLRKAYAAGYHDRNEYNFSDWVSKNFPEAI